MKTCELACIYKLLHKFDFDEIDFECKDFTFGDLVIYTEDYETLWKVHQVSKDIIYIKSLEGWIRAAKKEKLIKVIGEIS